MPQILLISYTDNKRRQMILEQRGFEVKSARHLDEAVDLCKKQQFDLLILDDSLGSFDKEYIRARLEMDCAATVLAILRGNESPLASAQYNLQAEDPFSFIELVNEAVGKKGTSA